MTVSQDNILHDHVVEQSSTDLSLGDENATTDHDIIISNASHTSNESVHESIENVNEEIVSNLTETGIINFPIGYDKEERKVNTEEEVASDDSETSAFEDLVTSKSQMEVAFHPTEDEDVPVIDESPLNATDISSLSLPPKIEDIDFVDASAITKNRSDELERLVEHSIPVEEKNEMISDVDHYSESTEPEGDEATTDTGTQRDEPQWKSDSEILHNVVEEVPSDVTDSDEPLLLLDNKDVQELQSNATSSTVFSELNYYDFTRAIDDGDDENTDSGNAPTSTSTTSSSTIAGTTESISDALIGDHNEIRETDEGLIHIIADTVTSDEESQARGDDDDDDDEHDDDSGGNRADKDSMSESSEKGQIQEKESLQSTPNGDVHSYESPIDPTVSGLGQPSGIAERTYPSLAPVPNVKTNGEDIAGSFEDFGRIELPAHTTSSDKRMITEDVVPDSIKNQNHLTVSIVTWNLAEESPSEEDATFIKRFRRQGKDRNTGSDLVLISGQECENIKPRRSEGSRSREFRRLMIMMLGKDYVPLALHLLGGIQFGLFCKRSILGDIEQASVADVTCGIGNVFHNKGAIGCFLKIKAKGAASTNPLKQMDKSVRMLFVTAHMAAHVKNTEARDSDFWRIVRELELQAPPQFLSKVNPVQETNGKLLLDSTDRIFFCGDLNYRIDLPREDVEYTISRIRSCMESKLPDQVLEAKKLRERLFMYDQLRATVALERAFPGFAEGRITFAPTFKFDKGTDEYDTSYKQRIPAWTDRVLYKPIGTQVLEYDSILAAQHSDHRPVFATFLVDMTGRILPGKKRRKRPTKLRKK
jgi:hypothetical protein